MEAPPDMAVGLRRPARCPLVSLSRESQDRERASTRFCANVKGRSARVPEADSAVVLSHLRSFTILRDEKQSQIASQGPLHGDDHF